MSNRLTQRQYILLLALISAAVLFLGVWLKPQRAPEPTISGEETLRLQTLTQRRNLENLSAYFSGIANEVQPGIVWIQESAMTGILWNREGRVISASSILPARPESHALSSVGEVPLQPESVSSEFPVSSWKITSGGPWQPARKIPPGNLAPGTSILQIARQAGGTYIFTPGVFGGVAPVQCGTRTYQSVQANIPLNQASLGGGLYDVDGNLIALVIRCEDHFAAITPAEVEKEVIRANSFDGQLIRNYGLRLAPLNENARKFFGVTEGVLITEVVDLRPAGEANLQPGDVITGIDKATVASLNDLTPLTQPQQGVPFVLDIRRNRRTIRVELPHSKSNPDAAQQPDGLLGIALANPAEGFLISEVAPSSKAGSASLQPGDRILTINGNRPPNAAAVRKVLSGSGSDSIYIVFQRDSRKIGVFLN